MFSQEEVTVHMNNLHNKQVKYKVKVTVMSLQELISNGCRQKAECDC